jgi:monofunctional biosynthetic peptidoglycan transglycosylase
VLFWETPFLLYANKPKKKRSLVRRLLRWITLAVVAWFVLGIVAVLLLRFMHPVTSAFMIERRVAAIFRGERDFSLRYRWTPWEQVSRQLPIALIAAEDQKFPFHHGFDIDAIQDALADAEEGDRLRGASTISQQVAKNLFLWNGRSFVRKGLEAYYTVLIEALWPKRRILEVYLNTAEFGRGVFGASAASERYFAKPPSQLNLEEASLLAAALPSPKRSSITQPSDYLLRRAGEIERATRGLGGSGYLARL